MDREVEHMIEIRNDEEVVFNGVVLNEYEAAVVNKGAAMEPEDRNLIVLSHMQAELDNFDSVLEGGATLWKDDQKLYEAYKTVFAYIADCGEHPEIADQYRSGK